MICTCLRLKWYFVLLRLLLTCFARQFISEIFVIAITCSELYLGSINSWGRALCDTLFSFQKLQVMCSVQSAIKIQTDIIHLFKLLFSIIVCQVPILCAFPNTYVSGTHFYSVLQQQCDKYPFLELSPTLICEVPISTAFSNNSVSGTHFHSFIQHQLSYISFYCFTQHQCIRQPLLLHLHTVVCWVQNDKSEGMIESHELAVFHMRRQVTLTSVLITLNMLLIF